MFGIPPGNNLRSRLPGMLVRNVCILHLRNVEICWRIPKFLKADGITLLGESVMTCWLTLWGIKIYWLCSSAELTLVLWLTEQLDSLDDSLLFLFLRWERKTSEMLIVVDGQTLLLIGK